jgi:hypothetical protein
MGQWMTAVDRRRRLRDHPGLDRSGGKIREADTKTLWDWAQNYKVRSFTEVKKRPKGGGPDHQ